MSVTSAESRNIWARVVVATPDRMYHQLCAGRLTYAPFLCPDVCSDSHASSVDADERTGQRRVHAMATNLRPPVAEVPAQLAVRQTEAAHTIATAE
jgi:hypothetical protein